MLDETTKQKIDKFIENNDFGNLYESYAWRKDEYNVTNGFKNIVNLECKLREDRKNGRICYCSVNKIGVWGTMRDKNILFPCYVGIENKEPGRILCILNELKLQGKIKGLGPTYMSKILRFLLPCKCGAIDTRIVKIFGYKEGWLNLKLNSTDNAIIDKNGKWICEYLKWLDILKYICKRLKEKKIPCPHPTIFYDKVLRENSDWLPADVEMALFAKATKVLSGNKKHKIKGKRCQTSSTILSPLAAPR